MRILVATGIFPPDIGGPATYVDDISAELAALGHQVRVVTLADEPEAELSRPFQVERYPRRRARLARMGWLFARFRELAPAVDVAFVHGLELPALAAARWCGVPSVLKVVGDVAWEQARNRGLTRLDIDEFQTAGAGVQVGLLKELRRGYVRHADRVITPSEYLKRLVVGWGARAETVTVIRNAPRQLEVASIDRGEARRELSVEGRVVLSVGRLTNWKGFDHLIRALEELPEDVRLVIAGDGPEEGRLRRLAEERGVTQRVELTGRLSRDGVARWMRAADVFALYSTYEGLSHVLLEAMASEVPIVASDCGGNPEVVEDGETGLLVAPGEPGEVAGAVRQLLDDPAWAQAMAAAGRARLERFSWGRLVVETASLLEATRRGR